MNDDSVAPMGVSGEMRAMVMTGAGRLLELRRMPVPRPAAGELLIRVKACGVCRTDLHIVDGELTPPRLPLVLGHEIVGEVAGLGQGVDQFALGQRVGVPWVGRTCEACEYCRSGQENLCDSAAFTGFTLNGGFCEYTVADARFCFAIPDGYTDLEAAPLLCAGLIGYRAYRMAGEGVRRLGIYGFGAAAHIIAQVAAQRGQQVYAFSRPGDIEAQAFARRAGAVWAGGSDTPPPDRLDAALLFAPVGGLVPAALSAVRKGGVVVCGGIHMSDIPSFPYRLLWEERSIRSVANLTRRDGEELMAAVEQYPVRVSVVPFPLDEANTALEQLRAGRVQGAAVLVP